MLEVSVAESERAPVEQGAQPGHSTLPAISLSAARSASGFVRLSLSAASTGSLERDGRGCGCQVDQGTYRSRNGHAPIERCVVSVQTWAPVQTDPRSAAAGRRGCRDRRSATALAGRMPQSAAALRWLRNAPAAVARQASTAAIQRPSGSSPGRPTAYTPWMHPVQTPAAPRRHSIPLTAEARPPASCPLLTHAVLRGRIIAQASSLRDVDFPRHRGQSRHSAEFGRASVSVRWSTIRSTATSSACSCSWTLRSSRSATASAVSSSSSSSSSTSAISGARKRWAKAPVSRATKPMPTIRITVETISPPVVVG